MGHDNSCIFCRIIAGEIPCFKLYEDDRTLAFMDINPVNPGHCLVVPKEHDPNLYDSSPKTLTDAIVTAQKVAVAVRRALDPAGLNLLQANGPGAAQSVQHFHLHVIPRRHDDGMAMNWGIKAGDMVAIGALAERIRAAL
ncbi:MAG: HIT domain-containing protein [Azospirillum sp.]|nr:HIT domain-containing protein [Azospirillum sp.]